MSYYEYPKGDLPHHLRCPHTIATMRPLICQDCTADELSAVYLELKRAYYAGTPHITEDPLFDRYESMCRTRYPMCEVFYTVGYPGERVWYK